MGLLQEAFGPVFSVEVPRCIVSYNPETELERGAGLLEKLLLFRRRLPPEKCVAVGIAAEAVDDPLMLQLEAEEGLHAGPCEQLDRLLVMVRGLAVHERHVEKGDLGVGLALKTFLNFR